MESESETVISGPRINFQQASGVFLEIPTTSDEIRGFSSFFNADTDPFFSDADELCELRVNVRSRTSLPYLPLMALLDTANGLSALKFNRTSSAVSAEIALAVVLFSTGVLLIILV
ncbi:hypothetical protein RHMOL_Rhmol09G0009300 [Rhododendron molle]|uniref:Uncharacterized protein n=1 Tax=Rhododendron molle TaxID=49168 RepID=A0ACC0M9S0_RHOML|nr:hypothetical protein RHMOL_Rhmol09G0009300 [Rhododendron molle]